MSTERFRCIHCGNRFNLSPEDMANYNEGFYMSDPDCCDDCFDNISYQNYDEYSDADPGL